MLWIDQDGEGICTSMPKYGNGDEPGKEAGYIVGMSSCYPEPVKVSSGETLTLEFNYSSAVGHTGVMRLFYILVAQQLPEPESSLPALFQVNCWYQISVWAIPHKIYGFVDMCVTFLVFSFLCRRMRKT